jgi:lipoate-protein ligase A
MKLIQWDETDAYYNLAVEEYVLQQMGEEEFILLWQNRNAVVVGRHQNTIEEINTDFVREHDVQVVRRLTVGERFIMIWVI